VSEVPVVSRGVIELCVFLQVKQIVITGHSLGAAVASVLAILFKHRHRDEAWVGKLKAVTFGTPGATMKSVKTYV
jgi:putative lipase involved disintegration of autophagic bodies